jgi:drug/metabolite transporter (DMT)-like permease
MTLASFGMLLMFNVFASFGQVCMKIGLGGEKIPVVRSPLKTLWNILGFMIRPWVLGGLVLYVLSAFTWLLLLSRVRLSVAFPMISVGYILVVLLSRFVLHERVIWKYAIAGLILIGIGVSFIGLGLGQVGGR